MSTIKSSAEDLTLNADGSGNDVIIQSNGSTKAIITAEGKVGIGTSSPTSVFEISGTGAQYSKVANGSNKAYMGVAGDDKCYFGSFSATDVVLAHGTSGQWTLNSSGNLFPAGTSQGIVLGNTSDVAANRLDDYEEGTFTPSFGNVTVTNYDAAAGWYIKIGNQVFVEGICSADNYDNSDPSAIQISGLPFTILTGDPYAVFSIYPEKGLNHVSPRLLGITEQTYALGGKFDYGTGQNTNWLAYSLCGSHLRYRFSGHYRV